MSNERIEEQRNHASIYAKEFADRLRSLKDADANEIWEAYMLETPAEYRSPQGAMVFAVDHMQRKIAALTIG